MAEKSYFDGYDDQGEYRSQMMREDDQQTETVHGYAPETVQAIHEAHEKENSGGLVGDRDDTSPEAYDNEALRVKADQQRDAIEQLLIGAQLSMSSTADALERLWTREFKDEHATRLLQLHFCAGRVVKRINEAFGHYPGQPILTKDGLFDPGAVLRDHASGNA